MPTNNRWDLIQDLKG